MKQTSIITPIGILEAIADNDGLHLLLFNDYKHLARDKMRLEAATGMRIQPGTNAILKLLEKELAAYFAGQLKRFTVPLHNAGTPFQHAVWDALCTIPHGTAISYKQLAAATGNAQACRAVANANGKNKFVIIIPCHRVINADGKLGGYSNGIERKKWLLTHEQ